MRIGSDGWDFVMSLIKEDADGWNPMLEAYLNVESEVFLSLEAF